jgi:hypothetical protein
VGRRRKGTVKKVLAMTLVAIFALLIAGCGGESAPAPIEEPAAPSLGQQLVWGALMSAASETARLEEGLEELRGEIQTLREELEITGIRVDIAKSWAEVAQDSVSYLREEIQADPELMLRWLDQRLEAFANGEGYPGSLSDGFLPDAAIAFWAGVPREEIEARFDRLVQLMTEEDLYISTLQFSLVEEGGVEGFRQFLSEELDRWEERLAAET